tara:strand:+ start:5881 stop:6333 length:453 start_codon:yes stop_codon:yes gene_type:complete
MDWGSIASAVGGAAKEAMSNAPEASGLHQSAAAERHAEQRELDAKMKEEQAEHERNQQRYTEDNEKLMADYNAAGAASRARFKSYLESSNMSMGGINNFVLGSGNALFNLTTPQSVKNVWDMSARQDNRNKMLQRKNPLPAWDHVNRRGM